MARRFTGSVRVFDYPKEFVTLPAYSEHRGQAVKVIRPLIKRKEYDYEGERMYEVKAKDGWTGHAWESELQRVAS